MGAEVNHRSIEQSAIRTPSEDALTLGEILRKLLFDTPVRNGRPLAPNASKLAERIGDQSGGVKGYSAKSSLSAMLSAKRAPSDKLHRQILDYVEAELNGMPEPDVTKWVSRVNSAIVALRNRLFLDTLQSLGVAEDLTRLMTTSKQRFLIPPTYLPYGKLRRLDPDLEPLRLRTTTRILEALLDDEATPIVETQGCYVLGFAGRVFAGHFWRTLFRILISEWKLSADHAVGVLATLESKLLLQTYVLDECFCLTPIFIFDPQDEETEVFQMYGYNTGIAPFKVPATFIEPWKRFFKRLIKGELADMNCTLVRFAEFESFLRQEYEFENALPTSQR